MRDTHFLPQQQEYVQLIARYNALLEQCDFAAVLELLEQIEQLVHCRVGFRRDLERAAETMGLTDKLPALRRAFSMRSMRN